MYQERNRQRKQAGLGENTEQDDHSYSQSSVPTTTVSDSRRQYNSVQEYARTLQHWMLNYQCMASVGSFYTMLPYYMSTSCGPCRNLNVSPPGNSPRHAAGSVPLDIHVPAAGTQPRTAAQRPAQTSSINQGTEYILPSVFKRFVAEVIDFFILFYIKLVVSIGVMRQMGGSGLELDHLELEGLYRTITLSPEDVDLDKVFALTSEIIALEIVNRICITIVETLCLQRGIGGIGGATPGKRILGLCVVRFQNVIDLGNGRIIVQPAENIGFKRALVRSIIKNFTVAFFFPACLTMFIFHHNRAAYDVIAGTLVVQNTDHQERQ